MVLIRVSRCRRGQRSCGAVRSAGWWEAWPCIGERFDVDANIVRVVFVVLTVLYGLGAAIYLAMGY